MAVETGFGVIVVDNGEKKVPVLCELDSRGVAQGVIANDQSIRNVLNELLEMLDEQAAERKAAADRALADLTDGEGW